MLRTDLAPDDARPVHTAALGDGEAAQAVGNISVPEPNLPPPNLSDTARFNPTPAAVDALKNPLPTDPRVVRAGHTMFLNRCVQCHNSSGVGYGPVGQYLVPHPPDLASELVQHRSDGAVYWHITNGQGKMPPFKTWTTPTQRWELVSFVRSLGAHRIPNANATAATDPDKAPVIGPLGGSDTQTAPYPVYGLSGFERGITGQPFKVLPARP
jgi:mono/diheme cytochrome c family protein